MQILFLIFLLSAWDDFLDWFLADSSVSNGKFIAQSWFSWMIIWAIIWILVIVVIKAVLKSTAKQPEKQIWLPRDTWQLAVGGLVALFISLAVHLYLVADFWDYIGVKGLGWGVVFASVLYLVGIVLAHLPSSWRRELF